MVYDLAVGLTLQFFGPAPGSHAAPETIGIPGGHRVDSGYLTLYGVVWALTVTFYSVSILSRGPTDTEDSAPLHDLEHEVLNIPIAVRH